MTILEHFKQAKADGHQWADAAIENTDPLMLSTQKDSIAKALISAFDFSRTPEGKEYWISAFESLFPSLEEAFLASMNSVAEYLIKKKNEKQ